MNRPNLWWSYNEENGSFSALPAGPLLLPAMAIALLIGVWQSFRDRGRSAESILGHEFTNSDSYKRAKARHDYLVNKKIEGAMGYHDGLSVAEAAELRRLQYPSWKHGDQWTY